MTTDLGTLIEIDGRPALRFERLLEAAPDRVWRAVTDDKELAAWFPSRIEGERRVGAPLRFPFEGGEAPTFDGEVLEWEPPRVFAFRWNQDVLRIELAPDGDGTRLVFTQMLVDGSEAPRTGSGWHMCLDALSAHVGHPRTASPDWQDLFARYVQQVGPPPGRRDGDSLVFERAHHLPPTELQAVIGTWDGADSAIWTVEPALHGSTYEVRVATHDPSAAARWHASLIELDMYAASGRRVDVDPAQFVENYRRLLP